MSELVRAVGIEKGFDARPVLRGATLSISTGERVGLVGVNGSGKTTLVRILCGAMDADSGTVEVRGRLAWLDQEPVLTGRTVGETIDSATAWHAELLAAWERAMNEGDLAAAGPLQSRLDLVGWEIGHRAEAMMTRVGAPPRDALVAKLSGGERRRVALALTLLDDPEVLVLDEPTNHLDAQAVEWLEGLLQSWRGALLLVTHDRYLLEAVATRVVEVEDGVTVNYDGSYADYLLLRAERRAAQEQAEDSRLNMIAREAEWASRSPAAQTSKQKARLDRLAALMAKRPLRREDSIILDLRSGFKLGGTVVELTRVRKSFGAPPRKILHDVDLSIRAGDRLGVLGPNGAGKTTLLKLLTQQEQPDKGEIVRGARVRAALFDQERSGLDLRQTVWEAAGDGNDQVKVGDQWIHVASFLSRFLFTREHHQRRVSALSGGERARLLLARLLLRGANLLLLDEPTNDLDLVTLGVLEEALLGFDGALVVVTHDRAFLDRVCNAVVVFEGDGKLVRYASRLQALDAAKREAEAARKDAEARARVEAKAARAEQVRGPAPTEITPSGSKKKLGFKEQRELAELPAKIAVLEAEQGELAAKLANPAVYRDGSDVPGLTRRLDEVGAAVVKMWARWEELEARA